MPSPIVVLDPGHGGRTVAGGSSPNNARGYNGLLERDLTLDLARRVVAAMSKRVTAEVRLTRTTDVNLSLADRAAAAKSANADVFVSLHFNGSDDPAVDGTEAWIAASPNARSQHLAQRLCSGVANAARIRNRGVRQRDLGVLKADRHTPNTAACLLEVAFLSNHDEASRLAQAQHLDTLAEAVARSIGDALVSAPADALSAPQAVALGGTIQQRLVSAPALADHLLRPDRKGKLPATTPTLAIRWNVDPAQKPQPGKIDLAVHFHGFTRHGIEIDVAAKARDSGVDLDARKRPTLGLVPRGWKTGAFTTAVRLDANKKPVLGPDNKPIQDPQADVVDFPALVDNHGKGLADLIRWSTEWLEREVLGRTTTGSVHVDRLILTAHSGGGARLLKALANGQDPHELHIYDAFYQAPDQAVTWVGRRIQADARLLTDNPEDRWPEVLRARGGACRVLAGGGTVAHSRALQAAIDAALAPLPPAQRALLKCFYRVEQTSVGHSDIPGKFGSQLMADAGSDVTPAVTAVAPVAPARAHAEPSAVALDERLTQYYACLAKVHGIHICPKIPPVCIPPRAGNAPDGSAVMALPAVAGEKEPKAGAIWKAREQALFEQIVAGNIPSFLRRMKNIKMRLKDRDNVEHDVEYSVMPDYLAVGSDTDFVTVPLDGVTAQWVADTFGCMLPTAKMVWDIHGQAAVQQKVRPRPYAALADKEARKSVPEAERAKYDGKDQASTWAYVEYSDAMRAAIEAKLQELGLNRQALVSGYKKDVVIGKALETDASKLIFFGGWLRWKAKDGSMREILQGAAGGYGQQGPHHARFADYSHGIRLVSHRVVIDGAERSMFEVLADPVLGRMLAHDAPFKPTVARYR